MARLDRLGAAREVAQIGAAIGREFSHALLGAVIPKPEADLGSALERLIDAGLLFRQGVPPDATYLFNHALVQDAAYGTLLRRRRQELHGRIVSVLQCDFPELIVSQPEVLARHCAEAGMVPEAIEYYLSASQHATAASNNIEASAHLRRGMVLYQQLSASDPRKAAFRDRLAAGGWWWAS
jgi:predicted ATPase